MNRFPLSIDLSGKTVCLIGSGKQIQDKAEKLKDFGPELIFMDSFTPEDAKTQPAMVIVGDTSPGEAEQIYNLCMHHGIAVNVVDVPRLCSFYFPALITRGSLTVSISTGGHSPAAASYLRQSIEQALPENTEAILDWISLHRSELRQKGILAPAIAAAFSKDRPLTAAEIHELASEQTQF